MSTETETVTELDQRTKDELAPPCEVRYGKACQTACDRAAAWIATWRCCSCDREQTGITCDEHAHPRGKHNRCGGAKLVVSLEPLR